MNIYCNAKKALHTSNSMKLNFKFSEDLKVGGNKCIRIMNGKHLGK